MRPVTSFLGSVMLLGLAGVAGAQEPPAETSLAAELARLSSSMREIVKLLERQVEGQETSLLIKRVELSGRTLIAKKERLHKARSEAVSLGEQEEGLARLLETLGSELSETAEDDAQQQMQLDMMEQQLRSVKRRRQDLERELMVLENEVAIEEEDMEVFEAVLDERLGLR